jgi:hypothetical protein
MGISIPKVVFLDYLPALPWYQFYSNYKILALEKYRRFSGGNLHPTPKVETLSDEIV